MHDPFHPNSFHLLHSTFPRLPSENMQLQNKRYVRLSFKLIPLKNHKTHLHQLNKTKYKNILPTFLSSNIFPPSPPIHTIPSFKIQQNSYDNVFFQFQISPPKHTTLPQHSFLLLSNYTFFLSFYPSPFHKRYFLFLLILYPLSLNFIHFLTFSKYPFLNFQSFSKSLLFQDLFQKVHFLFFNFFKLLISSFWPFWKCCSLDLTFFKVFISWFDILEN